MCAKLCLTLCDPMDCSPPDSSVHGILQARILEWVAISFSKGSSWPRQGSNPVSYASCIGRQVTIYNESPYILGWPKSLFSIFLTILWKNPNKVFAQPNISNWLCFSEELIQGLTVKRAPWIWGVMEIFCILILRMVTWVYPFINTQGLEHLYSRLFITCKLYYSKIDLKINETMKRLEG